MLVCINVTDFLSASVGCGIACLQEDMGLWTFATPIPTLYSPDVPKPLATEAVAALRPMTIEAVADISAALVTDWAKSVYAGSMAYVRCTQDNTVPIDFQDMMLTNSGGEWTIVTMDTSHSPFLSHTAEMFETVASFAIAFTK